MIQFVRGGQTDGAWKHSKWEGDTSMMRKDIKVALSTRVKKLNDSLHSLSDVQTESRSTEVRLPSHPHFYKSLGFDVSEEN